MIHVMARSGKLECAGACRICTIEGSIRRISRGETLPGVLVLTPFPEFRGSDSQPACQSTKLVKLSLELRSSTLSFGWVTRILPEDGYSANL
jgi:hypothetical protein